jgi:hypothetical protein
MAHRYQSIGRGRPSKALRYINALAGVKSEVKKEVKREVKKEIHRGRPTSPIEHLRVLGGSLRVKTAKSRTIRIGNKELRI